MKKGLFVLGAGALSLLLNVSFAADTQLEVKESITLNTTPDKVWALIGGFNDLPKWHPAIAKSVIETKDKTTVRHLTLKAPNDPVIVESLVENDAAKMTYSYHIDKVDPAVLPVQNYIATLSVAAAPTGTTVLWEAHFQATPGVDAATAQKAIKGVFTSGLNNLGGLLMPADKKVDK